MVFLINYGDILIYILFSSLFIQPPNDWIQTVSLILYIITGDIYHIYHKKEGGPREQMKKAPSCKLPGCLHIISSLIQKFILSLFSFFWSQICLNSMGRDQ